MLHILLPANEWTATPEEGVVRDALLVGVRLFPATELQRAALFSAVVVLDGAGATLFPGTEQKRGMAHGALHTGVLLFPTNGQGRGGAQGALHTFPATEQEKGVAHTGVLLTE